MPYHLSVNHAVERAARELNARDSSATLFTIVDVARRSMPGIDHVGVTRAYRSGRLRTIAATGPLVSKLDDLQYALGQGPCVDAVRGDAVVVVEHARREQRWPLYLPAAVRAGLRSELALRLCVDGGESLGSLNLYSTSSDTIPPETLDLAELVATQVAVMLKHLLLDRTLSAALESRAVIRTAMEVVRHRYGVDNERAFAFLARVSHHSNVTLNEVAREVVAGVRDAPKDRVRSGSPA